MSKRAHKRQKTSSLTKPASKKAKVAPAYPTLDAAHYDALADDAAKDDEERRLESLLFGTAFEPASKGKGKATFGISVLDGDDEHEGGGREFENMLDTDVSEPLIYYNNYI
jgi:U3 small nucleolar RNA-associated protein 18